MKYNTFPVCFSLDNSHYSMLLKMSAEFDQCNVSKTIRRLILEAYQDFELKMKEAETHGQKRV